LRAILAALAGLGIVAMLHDARAEPLGAPAASYEVVKNHIEVEVKHGGSYLESREVVYKVLTEAGAQALRQVTLTYTQGFQTYQIGEAYTLKADGTRVYIDPHNIMNGYGASTSPGYEDLMTMTVIFPNLEVGDEIVLTTVFAQTVPWFGDEYSEVFQFSRQFEARDVTLALTAPSDMPMQIDALRMQEAQPEILNGKKRWVWKFQNTSPSPAESSAVDEFDTGPRVVVSSFPDYKSFAEVYAGMLKGRADATPEIRELANRDGIETMIL